MEFTDPNLKIKEEDEEFESFIAGKKPLTTINIAGVKREFKGGDSKTDDPLATDINVITKTKLERGFGEPNNMEFGSSITDMQPLSTINSVVLKREFTSGETKTDDPLDRESNVVKKIKQEKGIGEPEVYNNVELGDSVTDKKPLISTTNSAVVKREFTSGETKTDVPLVRDNVNKKIKLEREFGKPEELTDREESNKIEKYSGFKLSTTTNKKCNVLLTSGMESCSFCPEVFNSEKELKKHKHLNHENFHCDVCFEAFETKRDWMVHKTNMHGKLACTLCPKRCNKTKQLKKHMRNFHDEIDPQKLSEEKTFVCRVCSEVFKKRALMRRHKANTHIKLNCQLCPVGFYMMNAFTKHMSARHADNVFNMLKCPECSMEFGFNEQLKSHFYRVHSDSTVVLRTSTSFSDVDREFYNECKSVAVLAESKCEVLVIKCKYCSLELSNEEIFWKHLSDFHAGLKCYICGTRTYLTLRSLLQHQKTHKRTIMNKSVCSSCSKFHICEPLRYSCIRCTAKFCFKKQLKCHRGSCVESMSKDDPREYFASNATTESYQCTYCASVFNDNAELRKHLTTQHSFTPDLLMTSNGESSESPQDCVPDQQFQGAQSSLLPGSTGDYNWYSDWRSSAWGENTTMYRYDYGQNYMMAPWWAGGNEHWRMYGWNFWGRGRPNANENQSGSQGFPKKTGHN